MLGFGLLGAGRIGRMHARNLAAHPGVGLEGVYDIDGAAARGAAGETGSRAFPTVDALLGSAAVDAVLIATSTDTHCDLIGQSVRAGKAVLCEKPIHLDIREVDRCRELVAASGMPVQIGFNRRFDPGHSGLRSAIEGGEIGKPELAVISSRDPSPPPLDYIRVSGGLYRDMMIHDFDIARFLMGEEPVEVAAMGSVLVDPAIGKAGDVDTAMVTMRMASGALCHINCSRRCSYGYDQRIEVFGDAGMLVSGNPTPTSLERFGPDGTGRRERLHHFFIERYRESYVREIDAFVRAVQAGTAPSPGFEDGRRALMLADAAVTSAATGRAVRV